MLHSPVVSSGLEKYCYSSCCPQRFVCILWSLVWAGLHSPGANQGCSGAKSMSYCEPVFTSQHKGRQGCRRQAAVTPANWFSQPAHVHCSPLLQEGHVFAFKGRESWPSVPKESLARVVCPSGPFILSEQWENQIVSRDQETFSHRTFLVQC